MAGNVQFILGRAGTGKSRLIQDRIVAHLRADPLGPPMYLVVPAQATFAHERHFALAAEVEGFARLRVVSFEMLGEDVIAECGGAAMVQVTHVGRQMLLGHLLRAHADELVYFQGVARQLGLVAELDRTFAELDRAGHGADEQLELLQAQLKDESGPEHEALVAKARDLAVLGRAYRKALGEDRLDATRRLEHVMKNLEDCRTLRQARIYVDGFYRFSAFERKLLAKLAGLVGEMSVALTLDPREIERTYDETALFFQTVTTYRHLLAELENAKLAVAKPIELQEQRRFLSPALAAIEHDFSQPRPSQRPGLDTSAVTLIEAPNPRAEADAAARQVRQWTSEGLRLREIAVLCRDLSAMQPLLEASFREHEIPFFTDRRRPAAHHPLARLVRALLRIATRNWPNEAVIDLCKCGLAGMPLDDADALENYVLEHRIRGRAAWTRAEPWRYHTDEPDETTAADGDGKPAPVDEKPDRIEAIRRNLADAIAPLHEALHKERPVRQHMAALWNCLEAFDVRKRLARHISAATEAGDLEQAAEHQQAWEELVALCEQAMELLGEEKIGGEDFAGTLEYGLDLLDLAIVPPRADEVVIGDVERTRTLGCRAAIVLGLNDGTFPRSHGQDSVLSDEERRILRERNVDVEPDGRSLQLTERFLAYRAFAAPSERLVLMRSAADEEGRPAAASPFWIHVQKLLDLPVQKLPPESADAAECIGTPRQLAAALMRWARAQGKTKDAAVAPRPDLAGLYQAFAEHRDLESAIGRMRRLAWRALSYRNKAQLRPPTAADIWKDGVLYTSVTRLESFAACPFRHYAAHVLKLRARDDDAEISPLDLGSVFHGVLERLVRRCIQEKLAFIERGAITDENIARFTREIGASIRGRIMLSNARNQYVLKRIETTLKGVIAGQQAVLRRGTLRPLETELKFGEGEGAKLPPLELTTQRGRRVRLYGQIDRVDYAPGTGHAAVIDYKLSGKTLELDEVSYGLSLQLLLYLLVLERSGAGLADPPPKPAAALYVKLLRGIESAKHPEDGAAVDPAVLDLRVKPRGIIDREALAFLDASYEPGARGDAYAIGIRREGELYSSGNDLVESADFRALLDEVERQVKKLADELIEGVIAIRPYKMGTVTPCPHCEFRSLCRFDSATDSYAIMPPRKREEVLAGLGSGRLEA